MVRWLWVVVGMGLVMAAPASADETDRALLAEGGRTVLIRHATAPGTGDPAHFDVNDCATQRNLSEAGRAQARRIGERFAAWGVTVEAVLSGRWCRSLDTARLAFGAERVEPFEPLDSFFRDRSAEPGQTAATKARIAGFEGDGVLVMVTHQVNITALTGIVPAQGEAIVVEPSGDEIVVVGRIRFD
ncbi:histidine phosphatase family protein [Aquibium carbonis]|uniref:Histidine phosphatase family protein n=1 Tax=Aquibium carbonis TaxID=2495581 RepID=A0A429YJ90_9HYPH|nr:histidine phosphatase family protein [Aquibium carbonis]RST81531.1 histidine phosphatase family protein [Aquibium carbonis]